MSPYLQFVTKTQTSPTLGPKERKGLVKARRGRVGWPRGQQNANDSVTMALGGLSISLTGPFSLAELQCQFGTWTWPQAASLQETIHLGLFYRSLWSTSQVGNIVLGQTWFLPRVSTFDSENPKNRENPLAYGSLLHPCRERIPKH